MFHFAHALDSHLGHPPAGMHGFVFSHFPYGRFFCSRLAMHHATLETTHMIRSLTALFLLALVYAYPLCAVHPHNRNHQFPYYPSMILQLQSPPSILPIIHCLQTRSLMPPFSSLYHIPYVSGFLELSTSFPPLPWIKYPWRACGLGEGAAFGLVDLGRRGLEG